MSKLKDILKKTPLRPLYWKLLGVWPLKQIRHYRGEKWRDKTLWELFPAWYKEAASRPVDENKVIFVENRIDELGNSFILLYEKLKKEYKFKLHVHYLHEFFSKKKEYEQRCHRLLTDMATAKYIFLSDTSPVVSCVDLRPETKVIQLWHACGAFKKFGMSTADAIFGTDMEGHKRHPLYRNYSFVTVSSPEVIWAYAEAMGLQEEKEKIVPAGISRTDIFFDPKAKEAAFDHLYEKFPAARGKKVILFAPTFRGRVANAKTAEAFDVKQFAEAFRDEYVLVTKHHPYVKEIPPLPEGLKNSFAYDATHTMSIEDLLMVSDICISDYSSLVFEYSLFERPMLFFAYDIDEYYDWRGFYYDYYEMTPGPVCQTNEEMIAWIRNLEHNFDPQRVISFREKFMSSCDGHATERILELAMGEDVLRRAKRKRPGSRPEDAAGTAKGAAET